MNTINTILGPVTIVFAQIARAAGHGQYNILVDINFEDRDITLKIHSTDSQLFDAANGDPAHCDIVLHYAGTLIEKEINNYIASL